MIYNVKQYDYAESRQLRIYKTPVTDFENRVKPPKEEVDKQQEKPRTPQQIEHSAYVSLMRSKQAIYEISRANIWDWFVTITFNRKLIDSSDYDKLVAFLSKWLNNIKFRKSPDLKYLLVPELHSDGIHFHFHGFFADADGLTFEDSGIVKDGKPVYNILDFNYGFTTATEIESSQKASSYISKYITKEIGIALKGKRRYLASRNCKRAEITKIYIPPDDIEKLLFDCSDDITHLSQKNISVAHQRVQYVELKK